MSVQRDVVERLLRVTADGDVEAALELCAPDVVYVIESLDTYRGHDGVREFLADQLSVAGVDRLVQRVVADGDEVAVERRDTFLFPSGAITVPTAAFFSLRDGLVTRWVDYQDLRDMARMLDH